MGKVIFEGINYGRWGVKILEESEFCWWNKVRNVVLLESRGGWK